MNIKDLGLKKFYVDIYDGKIRDSDAKEDEVNSRGLLIKFLDKGEAIQLPGVDVYLYIGKTPVVIYEEEAVLLQDGFYEVIFPQEVMKYGSYEAEIRLKKDGAVLATKTFNINIDKGVMTEGVLVGISKPDVVENVLSVLRSEEERKVAEEIRNEQYVLLKSMIDDGNVGKGDKGEPGIDGVDGKDGSNEGSHSAYGAIESFTNEHNAQVNVSNNSSASDIGWLINIGVEPEAEWIAIDMSSIEGDWELDYLVDGSFVYADIYEWNGIKVSIISKDYNYEYSDGELYPTVEGVLNLKSQVNASDSSAATGETSQVNASYKSKAAGAVSQVNASSGSEANAPMSQVNASNDSTVSGRLSQINSSISSEVNGQMSQVNSSTDSEANGYESQINSSSGSVTSGSKTQVNSSRSSSANGSQSQVNSSNRVENNTDLSSAYGSGEWNSPTSESNIKIHLLSATGDIKNSGVVTSGHNFTDYAELLPNLTSQEQGYGLIQTIDGYGVRPANEGDQIAGVTSATAGVILGETPFSWQARWLKDEWGAYIMEDVYDEELDKVITSPKQNPEWDPEIEQLTRQERPDEWTVVGLLGQVYVRLNEDVEVMDYVKPHANGVGEKSDEPTNIRVMKITKEYVAEDGYKIGFCLLR